MRVLIDIGHPAHVHYFKNFIKEFLNRGGEVLVVARDKEVSQQLLKAYNIPFISRGKGSTSGLGKLLYMVRADFFLAWLSIKHRPDVYLSVVSPYASQVAWLFRKPHIALDDTEHATLARRFYLPFSSKVVTPFCFQLDLGPKQFRINSFLELFYLHPNYRGDSSYARVKLGVEPNEPFALIRFVAWGASHDFGVKGIDDATKLAVIDKLKLTHRVFISAEGYLPEELEDYRIRIEPQEMHDVLAEADIYIGEGATMASECAMLGTPAIYINKLEVSYVTEECKHLSIVHCKNENDLLTELNLLLSEKNRKRNTQEKLAEYIKTLDDPNDVLMKVVQESIK